MQLVGGASALGKTIGRSEGAVRKWLRGESQPTVSDLRSICRASGANAEWLVNGVGDSGLIPSGVRESPAHYLPSQPMNTVLLEEIMTAVDDAALASETKIAINRKSTLVAALYGLCRANGIVDRSAVLRLMTLAV